MTTEVTYPAIPDGVYFNPHPLDIPVNHLPPTAVPLWQPATAMDLSIFVSEDEYFTAYQSKPTLFAEDILLGDSSDSREYHLDIPTTQAIQNNGSLYAHIFVMKKGAPIDPGHARFMPDSIVYHRYSKSLNRYYPKKSEVKQKNLLHKDDEESDQKAGYDKQEASSGNLLKDWTRQAPLASYWHENMTLSIISDPKTPIAKSAMQPATLKYIPFNTDLGRDASGKIGFYRPIVFPNEFWLLRQNAYPINASVSSLPLTVHLEPLSMWKFNMYAMFDDSMKQQANNPLGGMSSHEMDEVKRMLLETNPYLLVTTAAVSLLHSAFEFLAFKNDIAFWKKKDNSTGVSVRTLITNIFFQIVIFLYLLDNNQDTSWMILISQGVGLAIEIWKVFKALKYELIWNPGSFFPTVRTQESHGPSEEEDDTAKYDAIAFKYLMWLAYPLLAGYAVYSLLYDEHKSWYSYVLKTLVEFVYMFGFITMLPQLYINYRLKSVAHMPWKTLMYKSLNTFIDDLFAFVIKMPTLHRLACLRDDFVFFVYLYQRYKYKIDPKRANEYGQIGIEGEAEKKDGAKDAEEKTVKETKKTK
ncbi:cleft lip and palate transmembrane protein 1-domain-containing protein [Syncephalastrum racemosum]|uniref:Cleft lip and palate transmembrane protein 1-domain-containing protein n=1 Tax=Syncephalastrum racemosum TaxID=13706 RepID=A0A1X2HPF9_SYNRA|nr:cleft lip and palate transmembrane protein 1-domain-containing protein [Syncephalastrum racemosum]